MKNILIGILFMFLSIIVAYAIIWLYWQFWISIFLIPLTFIAGYFIAKKFSINYY